MLFALAAAIIECLGGLALVLASLTRQVALVVAVFLPVAATVYWSSGSFWTSGGFEYPLRWSLVALAISFGGSGRWSLDARLGG